MTTVNPELDSLDPQDEGPVTLDSGTQVTINRLRTREMLSLLRVLTRGAGGALADLDFSGETTDFAARLLGVAIVSIPEAEDETITFVQRMVAPVGLIEGRRLSKPEQEINQEKWADLAAQVENPELEDLFTIVERVIKVEAPHMQALGKKFAFLIQTATRTGTTTSTQTDPTSEEEPDQTPSESNDSSQSN